MDGVRNEDALMTAGIERQLANRLYQRKLRWFWHVERIDEDRMTRRVLMPDVRGARELGRPMLGWMDGLNGALGSSGMTVEAARQCPKDRKKWRALVHMLMIEFNAAIFALACQVGAPTKSQVAEARYMG